MIQTRWKQLPTKAKEDVPPMFYWVSPVKNVGFTEATAQARDKLSLCLESMMKIYSNMRTLKFEDGWDQLDSNLVVNDRFTANSLHMYWKALDASFLFNFKKRGEFVTHDNYRKLTLESSRSGDTRRVVADTADGEDSTRICEDDDGTNDGFKRSRVFHKKDGMQSFFKHNRMVDCYHWHKYSHTLPKPK